MRRVLTYAGVTVLMLLVLIIATGLLLPQDHTAVVRVRLHARPQRVYEVIVDVAHAKSWRSNIDSVAMLSRGDELARWKEYTPSGALTYELALANPPSHVETRIAGGTDAFGGGWTYEVDPDPIGTVVTITERGSVYNPIFRFMSRFVFGNYGMLETYARDLGRRFGAEGGVDRVLR